MNLNLFRKYWEKISFPLIALGCSLVVGFFIIDWLGKNPWTAYWNLFEGAFGTLPKFGETLVYVSPLLLTGLAMAVGFRCGLFNIGTEGQYIMGMMGAAWMGAAFSNLPPVLHIPLTMLTGAAAGCIWGGLPGYFKAKFGAHEVITTIMMNYIALHFTAFLVNNLLIAPPGTRPVTRMISDSAKLARFLPPSRLNTGIFVSLLCILLVYLFLWKTKWGFEIRSVGLNKEASRYAGVNVTRSLVLAMALSGGLAGLAGALQVQGIQFRFIDLFGFPGYGFDGITVALVGNNHPVGVLLGGLLFGAMTSGALQMQSVAGISKNLIGVIEAVIIFFVAADYLVKKLRITKAKNNLTAEPSQHPAGKENV